MNPAPTSAPVGRRPWLREAGRAAAAAPLFLAAPLVRPWHLRWGATDAEVAAAMPGDELVPGCPYRSTRAITIATGPREVWPWLVQVGIGRAGFYSLDLLDNRGRPSADTLVSEFQHLEVGQWVPMTSRPTPATAFTVHSFQAQRWLLWAKPDSTWAWQLTSTDGGGTRLVTRIRARYDWSAPAAAVLSVLLLEVGDFAMLRAMLLGIRERAERAAAARTRSGPGSSGEPSRKHRRTWHPRSQPTGADCHGVR